MRYASKMVAVCMSASLVLSLGLGLVGCSGASDSETQENKEELVEEVEEDALRTLGEASDDATQIALTNGVEDEIDELSVRVAGQAEGQDDMLAGEEPLGAGEEVCLFVELADDEAQAYDLTAVVGGDMALVFEELPLARMQSMTLRLDDDVAYVTYETLDGERATTKDAALARKAELEAEAQAEAESQATTDQASQETQAPSQAYTAPVSEQVGEQDVAEAVEEQQVVQETPAETAPVEQAPEPVEQTPEPVEQTPEPVEQTPEPVAAPVETSAPTQSEDACLEDVVLR